MHDAPYCAIPLCARDGTIRAYALVDESDYAGLAGYSWRLGTGYAYCRLDGRTQLMHRLLLGLERGDLLQADHINGDGLDNRRANLRTCTLAENVRHRSSRGNRNSTSGHRGVSWDARTSTWNAMVTINGRRQRIGRYRTVEEAAKAAEAARTAHGVSSYEPGDRVAHDRAPEQTHCVNGHLFDEANTYIRPTGHRACRMCTAARQRAYKARKGERERAA